MSKNEGSQLPKGPAEPRRNDKQRRKPDLRIRRTRGRLANALIALMQEKRIDTITVQEVLDRATVGRSTFYLHFRDKDDLFLCVLEDGLEMWSTCSPDRFLLCQTSAPRAGDLGNTIVGVRGGS